MVDSNSPVGSAAREGQAYSTATEERGDRSRRSVLAGVAGAAGTVAVAGCLSGGSESDQFPAESDTEWGETMSIGDGEVTTFVSTDPDGETHVGAEMTPGALEGAGSEHVKFVLQFPESDAVPFTWLGLDWEPGGHYPGDTYAIPHFDWHFYFAPQDLIADIPTVALPPEEHDQLYTYPVPEDQLPPNYFRTNYVFGYMGEHFYDRTAPEYDGGTFGNTFVYGHWDGGLLFMEPMITVPYFEQLRSTEPPELDQLDGVGNRDHRQLDVPERFPEAGEYPTEYAVEYHADRDAFTVAQSGFERFEASEGLSPDADTSRPWEEEPADPIVVESGGYDPSNGGGSDGHGHDDSGESVDADATVTVAPEAALVFDPETLEVDAGATVLFEWDGDNHNVAPTDQPDDASWAGEPDILDTGATHSHTFEVAGRYEYVCEPHESQGMTGTVVVGE